MTTRSTDRFALFASALALSVIAGPMVTPGCAPHHGPAVGGAVDAAVSEPPDLAVSFDCAPSQTMCGAACADTSSDASNCGGCGKACAGGQTCVLGACGCPLGSLDCGDGTCADVTADPANCGQCGVACRAGEPFDETCVGGLCRTPCDAMSAGMEGCSFYPVNLWSTDSAGEYGVVATNSSVTDPVTVTLADATHVISHQTVGPGGFAVFRLPQSTNKLDHTEQAKKAFHLTATRPVVAYQFHPIDGALVHTGSASLLLPEYAMGRDYYAMSYIYNAGVITSPPQGQGYVTVVALENATTVTVWVPVATMAGGNVPALPAGGKITRTLAQFEVLEIVEQNSLEDISGARVHASKSVVVYGGAGGITVPDTAPGGDHIELQMFPLTAWGKRFVASKMMQRTTDDVDHYRVLASVDGTNVKLVGARDVPPIAPLKAGHFVEFATASNFEIVADQPIFVSQYLEAWGAFSGMKLPGVTSLGDANATPLIPVEQYAKRYAFYVPATYDDNFVTVTANLTGMPPNLVLDGKPLAGKLLSVGGGDYGRLIAPLAAGNHVITGDAAMEILLYGYASYISYSYVGGGKLDIINPTPPPPPG